MKKGKGITIVLVAEPNFLSLTENMKAVAVSLLFLTHYQMCLKLKLIIQLDLREQSITVKSAVDIMDIFLMMVQNLLVKDIVTMDCVWFLLQKKSNLSNNSDIAQE